MHFGYTPFGEGDAHAARRARAAPADVRARRAALGYERRSVWTFTRVGAPLYASIARELYLGCGAARRRSPGDDFLVNHFGLAPYERALAAGRLPLARRAHLGPLRAALYYAFWQLYAPGIDLVRFRRMFPGARDGDAAARRAAAARVPGAAGRASPPDRARLRPLPRPRALGHLPPDRAAVGGDARGASSERRASRSRRSFRPSTSEPGSPTIACSPAQSGSSGIAIPESRPSSTARVIAALPNRSRTSSSAASRGPVSGPVSGKASCTAFASSTFATETPTSVRPRSRISGRAEWSSALCGLEDRRGLGGRVRQRRRSCAAGEVVEAQAQDDRAARRGAPRASAASRDRRAPISAASISCSERRRRPSARWAPIERRRRPVSTRRGSRLCASAWRCRPAPRPSSATSESASTAATCPTVRQPAGVQPSRRRRPDAPEPLDGEGVEERELLVRLDDEQPVRLGHGARDLREELRARDPDGDRQSDLARARRAAAGRRSRRESRRCAPSRARPGTPRRSRGPRPAGSRRGRPRRRPCSPRCRRGTRGGTTTARGAEAPRLRAAHRRPDPERLRLVARREDDPAADDHGAAPEPRVVALLDRREERVEVGVEDRRSGHDRTHVRIPDGRRACTTGGREALASAGRARADRARDRPALGVAHLRLPLRGRRASPCGAGSRPRAGERRSVPRLGGRRGHGEDPRRAHGRQASRARGRRRARAVDGR